MLARRLTVEAGIHPSLMPKPAEKLPLHSLLSLPRMSVKMLLRPKKLRKYQEMELTLQGQDGGGGGGKECVLIPLCAVHPAKWLPTYQDAPRLVSSMPLCNIGLNFRVRGNGTLAEREVEDHT